MTPSATPDQTTTAAGRPPHPSGRAWGDRQRSMLLALVDADPGIHVMRAAHVLGMNWNTCYHHARRLALDGQVVVSKVGGKLCLFDRRHGAVAPRVGGVLLRDARTAAIVRLLLAGMRLNQQELANRLGIAPSAAHRHLRRLAKAGFVQRVREAREVLSVPTPALHEAWAAHEASDGLTAPAANPPEAVGVGSGLFG